MSFKIKKIRPKKESTLKKLGIAFKNNISGFSKKFLVFGSLRKEKVKKFRLFHITIGSLFVCLGVFVVFFVTSSAYSLIKNFSVKNLVFSLGVDLAKDEHNNTNILIIGVGGQQHESPDLTDSMIIASIDKNNTISMLSIPRDLHVRKSGGTRINEVYHNLKNKYIYQENESIEVASHMALLDLKKTLGDMSGTEIPYYVKVDFQAVSDLIDAVGGIDIHVEKTIKDNYYPDDNWGYEPFYIKKGMQHINGETALKYARSRKTTSDFDRSRRQQKVIFGLKEKALKTEVLTSPDKLKEIFDTLDEHIETNLEWSEMLTLAEIASHLGKTSLISKVIHDDPNQEGGFLYTPERENFNGAFVLVPFDGNFENIQKFASLIFHHRTLFFENANIEILNGSKVPGVALSTYKHLNRYGFNIVEVANTTDRKMFEKTTIFVHKKGNENTVEALKLFMEGEIHLPQEIQNEDNSQQNLPAIPFEKKIEDADITIVIGENFDRNQVVMRY